MSAHAEIESALESLHDMMGSWTPVAEALDVSIAALRHWRVGASTPTDENKKNLLRLYNEESAKAAVAQEEAVPAKPVRTKKHPLDHPKTPQAPTVEIVKQNSVVELVFDALEHVATCEVRSPTCLTCRLAIVVSRVRPC